MRVSFNESADSSLRYQVSGDTRRLLAVRALNERGQILESGSASWSDVWFGSGVNASVDFYGKVAAAEVVLAESLEPVRYAFRLPGAFPEIDAGAAFPAPPLDVATPETLGSAMRSEPPDVTFHYAQPIATAAAGPAFLALGRMDASSFFGLTAALDVYVPFEFPLDYQLNGATVTLDQAVLSDGTTVDLDLAAPASFEPDGGYWMNGEFQPDENRPWLKGSASWQHADYAHDAPESVRGRVVFRSVRDTAELVAAAGPGTRVSEHGVDLLVSEWREGTLVARVLDGVERIVSITAVDADGNLAGRADGLQIGMDGTEANIDLTALPERLQILVAVETEEFERPFSVSLAQAVADR